MPAAIRMSQSNPVHGDIYESEDDYVSMAELDEENINWGKLCCRILSLFLLVGIIILVRTPFTHFYNSFTKIYLNFLGRCRKHCRTLVLLGYNCGYRPGLCIRY